MKQYRVETPINNYFRDHVADLEKYTVVQFFCVCKIFSNFIPYIEKIGNF